MECVITTNTRRLCLQIVFLKIIWKKMALKFGMANLPEISYALNLTMGHAPTKKK